MDKFDWFQIFMLFAQQKKFGSKIKGMSEKMTTNVNGLVTLSNQWN